MASGYVVTLNNVASDVAVPTLIIQRLNRQLLGQQRDTYIDVPGREDAWLFDEKPGRREIVLTCTIKAGSNVARRQAARAVAGWIDYDTEVPLVCSDEPDRFWRAKLMEAPATDEKVTLARFDLRFQTGPYAYALAVSSQTVTASADPASFGVSAIADPRVQLQPVIEVTPLNGTLTGWTLTGNGLSLVCNAAQNSGQTFTASGIAYVIYEGSNVDTDYSGAFTANLTKDNSGDFPFLLDGTNAFSFDRLGGTATNVRLAWSWRRRYR